MNWSVPSNFASAVPPSPALALELLLQPIDLLSKIGRALLERGFIKRETHGDDRRRSVLALSAAGFEVYETIAPLVIEITRKLMSVLSEEEEQLLETLILRLAGDGLERMGEGV
jgi:DNA-binding MarR family transcriptional regulator